MAKAFYTGVSGVARKGKQPYLGVNSVARKIKSGCIGVGGVAREFFALYTWEKYACTVTKQEYSGYSTVKSFGTGAESGMANPVNIEAEEGIYRINSENFSDLYIDSSGNLCGSGWSDTWALLYYHSSGAYRTYTVASKFSKQPTTFAEFFSRKYEVDDDNDYPECGGSRSGSGTPYVIVVKATSRDSRQYAIYKLTFTASEYEKGTTSYGTVTSSDPNAYPDDGGGQDGYWYVKQT